MDYYSSLTIVMSILTTVRSLGGVNYEAVPADLRALGAARMVPLLRLSTVLGQGDCHKNWLSVGGSADEAPLHYGSAG